MVKICQTGLLTLNFEIIPKKRIFRFLPKISAGHAWSWKIFFANFQILGPLGCQGWVVIPQNVKKSQNHCTLIGNQVTKKITKRNYQLSLTSVHESARFFWLCTRVQWFWLFFTFWGITTHLWHPKGPRIWKLAKFSQLLFHPF